MIRRKGERAPAFAARLKTARATARATTRRKGETKAAFNRRLASNKTRATSH